MERLFFVRHGETPMNKAGLITGRIETSLTKKGVEQAMVAGRKLKQKLLGVDLIVCSPYERAYDSAKLIAVEIDYPAENIQKNDLFVERSFGVLEGTLSKDFMDTHQYRDFDSVEGAETVEDLQERARMAYEYLQTLEEANILVVGHGAFARALKRAVQGLPYTQEYEVDTSIANAAIVELV